MDYTICTCGVGGKPLSGGAYLEDTLELDGSEICGEYQNMLQIIIEKMLMSGN